MKRLFLTVTALTLLGSINLHAQNTVCFNIVANPNSSDPALGLFTKYVDVFGCGIYAEASVSDDKVLHAAAVWAELIDNDEDGIVDDPALLAELQSKQALMPIFQADGNAAMNSFMNNYNGNGVSAVLWQSEIDPTQTGHWGDDASVEEILHTINAVGHVNVYPTAFGLAPNSSLLSAAMDVARGGQFTSVPASYPAAAWYHYDDASCDYECMAIEYLYWMIVSNMGILDDAATCTGIANEWEPCTQALLQSTDLLGYALITDGAYKLAQNAPDGNYCPGGLGVNALDQGASFSIFPNPATQNTITVKFDEKNHGEVINIRDVFGKIVASEVVSNQSKQINISGLSSGIYFVICGAANAKLIVQ